MLIPATREFQRNGRERNHRDPRLFEVRAQGRVRVITIIDTASIKIIEENQQFTLKTAANAARWVLQGRPANAAQSPHDHGPGSTPVRDTHRAWPERPQAHSPGRIPGFPGRIPGFSGRI